MKTVEKGWGQNILGVRPAALKDEAKNQVVTGNFTLGDDFFFFKAKVRVQQKMAHLQLVGEIFRLVRRRNTRVKIPEGINVHIVTKKIGDRQEFVRGPLQDLSLTGCRIAVYSEQEVTKLGDTVTGLLRYDNRKPMTVTGIVRHHKLVEKGRYDQVFGFEFTAIEDPERFQIWLVDLQRQAFSEMS
jgi:c-di-GMP-binding flagellar brake protein YcgR